jgi:hypothetical protein
MIDQNRFWIDMGMMIVADAEMEERYDGYTWML